MAFARYDPEFSIGGFYHNVKLYSQCTVGQGLIGEPFQVVREPNMKAIFPQMAGKLTTGQICTLKQMMKYRCEGIVDISGNYIKY